MNWRMKVLCVIGILLLFSPIIAYLIRQNVSGFAVDRDVPLSAVIFRSRIIVLFGWFPAMIGVAVLVGVAVVHKARSGEA